MHKPDASTILIKIHRQLLEALDGRAKSTNVHIYVLLRISFTVSCTLEAISRHRLTRTRGPTVMQSIETVCATTLQLGDQDFLGQRSSNRFSDADATIFQEPFAAAKLIFQKLKHPSHDPASLSIKCRPLTLQLIRMQSRLTKLYGVTLIFLATANAKVWDFNCGFAPQTLNRIALS